MLFIEQNGIEHPVKYYYDYSCGNIDNEFVRMIMNEEFYVPELFRYISFSTANVTIDPNEKKILVELLREIMQKYKHNFKTVYISKDIFNLMTINKIPTYHFSFILVNELELAFHNDFMETID